MLKWLGSPGHFYLPDATLPPERRREMKREKRPGVDLKRLIRTIPDYPRPGIMFRDITTLLLDPQGLRGAVDELMLPFVKMQIDLVAGIEARGFILGGAVAHELGKGFVPVRKKGKLPHKTIGQEYQLEYGVDAVEIHVDAIASGQRVLLVDDLIATGGTAEAAIELVRRSGGELVAAAFIIDLPELGGSAKLKKRGVSVHTLVSFEGR